MRITVISKHYGSQTINTNNFDAFKVSSSTPIFKIMEHLFDDWFAYRTQPGAPMGKDIQGMYLGELDQPAIYSKRGAIVQAIENLIEIAQESGKESVIYNTRQLQQLDIECAFEC